MSAASALARGQAAAEALMVDGCTIRRAAAGGTSDPDTGYPTQAYTELYVGKCRVQQALAQSQREDIGQDHLLLLRLEVQLPMSVTGLKVGDGITINASTHDADLAGRVFLIHDLAHASHKTARRVQCLERTAS